MSTKLTEYTKDEWRSVVHLLRPGLSEEEYDKMWDEFLLAKQKRYLN